MGTWITENARQVIHTWRTGLGSEENILSVLCGGLGVVWVLWRALGVRGQLEGISSFLLPCGLWGWDWACQPWRQHLSSLTHTSHPFFWGTVSCGSGWAQSWYVVENDTILSLCVHSSVYVAQTLMKVKGQLWEVSSFLLPRVSWVNQIIRLTQKACLPVELSHWLRGWLDFRSSSTAHMWDYRCVPPHSVYVLLGIKARTQQILYQLGHIWSPRALSFYA